MEGAEDSGGQGTEQRRHRALDQAAERAGAREREEGSLVVEAPVAVALGGELSSDRVGSMSGLFELETD